jgi:hypothetical protein
VLTLRSRLRHLSLLAFVAVFALALLPTVSRLLAHTTGSAAWVEVCTPRGLKQVAAADTSQPPVASAHLDHCPLCAVAGAALVPPAASVAMPVVAAAPAMPAAFGAAPSPLFAWAAARPRGPPAAA